MIFVVDILVLFRILQLIHKNLILAFRIALWGIPYKGKFGGKILVNYTGKSYWSGKIGKSVNMPNKFSVYL